MLFVINSPDKNERKQFRHRKQVISLEANPKIFFLTPQTAPINIM
jgi:hypothetical protein